jgi:hypothetical protein
VEDRLLFVIGAPRSGSTLLNRMLGSHSKIHAPEEPHLLTPIAHLGYYASVEQAPYDPIITRGAARELVKALPQGEADYLRALRAYTDEIYAKLLEPSGRELLLDKTPAYALVLDFVARLYPGARYIVLTRHPMAVWSSFVSSFFDGDHQVAHDHNPLLERYVPAIARFIREAPVPHIHVRYEEMVSEPESQVERICDHIGIPFEPDMVNYGEREGGSTQSKRGLGDPMTVAKEKRPTTANLSKWARELSGQPEKIAQCESILARLADEDLEIWGHSRKQITAELAAIDPDGPRIPRAKLTRYSLERRLAVRLRRNIHHNALGRLVGKIRFACDVLLR